MILVDIGGETPTSFRSADWEFDHRREGLIITRKTVFYRTVEGTWLAGSAMGTLTR